MPTKEGDTFSRQLVVFRTMFNEELGRMSSGRTLDVAQARELQVEL
jgi:hypothetical protein